MDPLDHLLGQKAAQAPTLKGFEVFRARAQEVFSVIAQRVRPGHLNIDTIVHEGQLGTLQPMLDLADPPDFRAGRITPGSLSSEDALQVAQEHVLDWATSNHDTHSENLVRTRDGRILSIRTAEKSTHTAHATLMRTPHCGWKGREDE